MRDQLLQSILVDLYRNKRDFWQRNIYPYYTHLFDSQRDLIEGCREDILNHLRGDDELSPQVLADIVETYQTKLNELAKDTTLGVEETGLILSRLLTGYTEVMRRLSDAL